MINKTVVCLGRYGDIVNALPVAYATANETGRNPKFAISREFASILDGVSYVEPLVFDVYYNNLQWAMQHCRGGDVIACQIHKHPDNRRLTESYQKESYRVAGWLNRFGTIPLVFDRRSVQREAELINSFIVSGKKNVLVCGHSISSPISTDFYTSLLETGYNIVDLTNIRAERIYDMLGLIGAADALVSVDTVYLHLARATKTPVVAIINNGWLGSIPPPSTRAVFRYADVTLEMVVEAIKQICG